MKTKLLKFDGITLNELVLANYPSPSWCDVYVEGKLLFENVTVVNGDHGVVYLYNTAYTTNNRQKLVAILKSDNYLIMARQTK